MVQIDINKTFATYAECEKWEKENIKDNQYNGYVVVCVMHESACRSEEVKLTYLLCC